MLGKRMCDIGISPGSQLCQPGIGIPASGPILHCKSKRKNKASRFTVFYFLPLGLHRKKTSFILEAII
jgi:hypothetical protein